MPGLNQTGPMGQGPMTGRRMGRCANSRTNLKNQTAASKPNADENSPEDLQDRGFGAGRGRRQRGFGMGRQNRFRNDF
jgi:hypothetical protein